MAFKGVDLLTGCIAESFPQIMPMNEDEKRDLLDASIRMYDGTDFELKIVDSPTMFNSFGMQMLCRTMYGANFSVLDGCPLAPARYGYFVFDPGGGTI